MTDRRPLGTGPVHPDTFRRRETEQPTTPRAQLAAERLPANRAAPDPKPTLVTGRCALERVPDGRRGRIERTALRRAPGHVHPTSYRLCFITGGRQATSGCRDHP
ncbi:hypothetical protein [Streptomyces sp. Ru71]|uniref:hypothetical protein n=1 Tax=Streptomyces sp. Ru71 TaxID=2080746 RepID=UPI0011B0156D|nr:hypothetical protein [Streptomyces sp. Ru71]